MQPKAAAICRSLKEAPRREAEILVINNVQAFEILSSLARVIQGCKIEISINESAAVYDLSGCTLLMGCSVEGFCLSNLTR